MLKKIFWVIVALLGLAGTTYLLRPQPLRVEVTQISQGDFQNFLRQDGITHAVEHAIVTSPASGVLEKITLKVGDQVKKGQVLAVVQWNSPMSVRAPMSGVISKLHRESSGPIERSQPLLEIVDNSKIEIVADFLTTEAVKLKGKEKVYIEKWGGDFPLEGHVRQIEPTAFTKISSLGVEEQRVNVIIDIDTERSKWTSLKDSFHVECRVLIQEMKNVWLLPVGTLFRQGEAWSVFVVENSKVKLVPVPVLEKNNSVAVVSVEATAPENLLAKPIVIYPPTELKEGVSVVY